MEFYAVLHTFFIVSVGPLLMANVFGFILFEEREIKTGRCTLKQNVLSAQLPVSTIRTIALSILQFKLIRIIQP